jgi:hypothetical protein
MKNFALYVSVLIIGATLRAALSEGSLANILAVASMAASMAALTAAVRERDEGFASIGFGIALFFAGFVVAHAAMLAPTSWWPQLMVTMAITALGTMLLGAGCVWIISRQQSPAITIKR